MFYMAGNMLNTYKPTNAILAIGGVFGWLAFSRVISPWEATDTGVTLLT